MEIHRRFLRLTTALHNGTSRKNHYACTGHKTQLWANEDKTRRPMLDSAHPLLRSNYRAAWRLPSATWTILPPAKNRHPKHARFCIDDSTKTLFFGRGGGNYFKTKRFRQVLGGQNRQLCIYA
jgi:hypothetical protein